MKRRLFFFCAISMVAGIFAGAHIKEFSLLFLIPLVLLPFVLVKKRFKIAVVLILFVLSLVNASCGYKEVNSEIPSASVSGVVSDVCLGESKSFIISDANVIAQDGTKLKIDNVFVSFSGEELPTPGETVHLRSTLYPYAAPAQNTGEVDTRFSAIADNIFFRAQSTNFVKIQSTTTVKTVIYSLKGVIFDKIFSATDNKDAAGVLYAFLTGDRAYISTETLNSFKAAGTSHLLALSGLHTGIIILVLSRILDLFKASRTLKLIIIGTFLILFCVFTGFSPSIVRAAIMACVVLFCQAAGFRYDLLNSLSLSACIILLFNPYRLFDVSFLLSFSAVLGIACLPNVTIKNRLLAKLYSSVSVTLGATVFTIPLSFYYFSSISYVSVLFNLIMVPIASLALFLLVIFIFLPSQLLSIPVFLIDVVLKIADRATLFSPITMLNFNVLWVPIIMIVLFLLSRFTLIKARFKILLAFLLTTSLLCAPIAKDKTPKVNVLAQTRELCVHVETNKNIFIGLDYSTTLLSYIKTNTRKIDAVVLLDKDDCDQFEFLRQRGIEIKSVIVPQGLLLDTELDVFVLNKNEDTFVDGLILSYSDDGIYLLLNGQSFFLGGKSNRADVSVFYCSEKDLYGQVVLKDEKLLSTEHYGMITVKNGKISTFLGE